MIKHLSNQNDPYRSLLELFLVVFALRTIFSRRTRGEGQSRNFVELTEKVGNLRIPKLHVGVAAHTLTTAPTGN
jgi:hypothetical protein